MTIENRNIPAMYAWFAVNEDNKDYDEGVIATIKEGVAGYKGMR